MGQAVQFSTRPEIDRLLFNMKKTKSTRFEAARRLKLQHTDTTYLVVVLSMGIIGFSIAPIYFPEASQGHEKLLGFLSVLYSVFVLAFSLIQDSKQRLVDAETLHRCSNEILGLRNAIIADVCCREITDGEVAKYDADYVAILDKYNVNHSDVDYEKTELSMWKEFHGDKKRPVRKIFLRISRFVRVHYIKGFIVCAVILVLDRLLPIIVF